MRASVVSDPALDDLQTLEQRSRAVGRAGVPRRRDEKGRSLRAGGPLREVRTHRHALAVRGGNGIRCAAQLPVERPAGEQPRPDPWSTRREGLASPQGSEDRLAAVLLGPHADESARVVPKDRRAGRSVRREPHGAVDPGPPERRSGPSLVDAAGRRGVGVGAADQSEGERVHADPLLLAQALDQRVARVVEPRDAALHAVPAGPDAVATVLEGFTRQVALLLEVAELVGPARDVREAVATLGLPLDLHHLDERLEPRALPRSCALLRLRRVAIGELEHPSVRQVRVVRDRDRVTARSALGAQLAQPLPEELWGRRVDPRQRELGADLVRKDHVAVDLAARRRLAVLPGVECREAARLAAVVEAFGGFTGGLPGRGDGFATRGVVVSADLVDAVEEAGDPGHPRREAVEPDPAGHPPRLLAAVDAAARAVVRRRAGRRAERHLGHPLRMVRHGGEVERAVDAERTRTGRRNRGELDRLAARIAVGVERGERQSPGIRVHRVGGMNVEVAEERAAKRGLLAAGRARRRGLGAGRGDLRGPALVAGLGEQLTARAREHRDDERRDPARGSGSGRRRDESLDRRTHASGRYQIGEVHARSWITGV